MMTNFAKLPGHTDVRRSRLAAAPAGAQTPILPPSVRVITMVAERGRLPAP